MKTFIKEIHRNINMRGQNEQEKQYLFPALYGNKAVTRREIGTWASFHNNLKAGKFEPIK